MQVSQERSQVTSRKSRNWMLPALAAIVAGVLAWAWADGGERAPRVIEAPVALPEGVK